MVGELGHGVPLGGAPWHARSIVALRANHDEILVREPWVNTFSPYSPVIRERAAAQQEGVRHLWYEGTHRESYLHRWNQVVNIGLVMGDPLPGEQIWLAGDVSLRWGRRPWVKAGSPEFGKQIKLWEREHASPLRRVLGTVIDLRIEISLRDLEPRLRGRLLILLGYHFHRNRRPPNKDPPPDLYRHRR